MQSDSLQQRTITRMQRTGRVDVMHVPETGHAPSLSDMNRIWFIDRWLCSDPGCPVEWSVMNVGRESHQREDAQASEVICNSFSPPLP
jgi:hypothetical protein